MSLLIPLGLLGLLSIIALILIYIIKPNYQQKRISSTYVWKLSLKYKKKRIPVSRLSQILIFLCQLLILALCAMLLAKPAILEERIDYKSESVVIIDASASMMVSENGESRFERAVDQVKDFANNVMDSDGILSVIVADYDAYFLAQRSSSADSQLIDDSLEELYAAGTSKCTYGSADIEGAVELAEQVLEINSKAEVYLYTATNYINKNGINVVSVAEEDEWNAAVLNCKATVEDDNYYSITIDAGCYGRDANITVYCDIFGVNDNDENVERISKTLFFYAEENEMSIKLTTSDFSGGPIYSFKYLHVYIEDADGFEFDNSYFYYGGQRQTIRIQYASSEPNNFFETICRLWRRQLKDKWNIEYSFLRKEDKFEVKGFDLYIFENTMPENVPTDGVVLLINPDIAPINSGLRLGDRVAISPDSTLGLGNEHSITKFVNPDNITIANYRKLVSYDGYDELLYYANDPVMLVKNERNSKIVLFTFSLNFSNLSLRKEFALMMYNMFEYFIPATITDYAFEIGQTVSLNARGEDLNISGPDELSKYFDEVPAELRVDSPGTYTLTQTAMDGSYIVEEFFVKVPNFESNITKEVDSLPLLDVTNKNEYQDKDLITYFAAAMVALLFVEWLLQAREYFR